MLLLLWCTTAFTIMELVIDIDFDNASKMWRANKTSVGNGSFKYVCGALRKDGGKCLNKPCKDKQQYCHLHANKKMNKVKKVQ